MILTLKAKQMFLKCFYDHAIKYFHDGLNIVVFLSPGCEFFSAKCPQFF